jgi:glutamyl-tRNA synthetase
MNPQVRTRFAPSPTGYMHVGGIRTALFAWLLARKNNGHFILRIEDTDKNREVEGSVSHIIESLKWLGIEWDEGADKPEAYGPYHQSERLSIYKEWALKLIETGRAYADPYSADQLEELRQQAKTEKRPFLYREHRPKSPPVWDGSKPLRFKCEPKAYLWQDEVMGELSSGEEAIDDFIIIKSDGYPTYNFAHIVDDYLMKISHVIRSQEFIASVPRYLNLYEALNVTPPAFVTVPYVMGPDGKKKLSKRDGAKDILDYRHEGYLPDALVNFIATLGWNDGTEQEVFSAEELIQKFEVSRIQKSGAHFDEQRLNWLNGHYIRQLTSSELFKKARSFLPKSADNYPEDYKEKVIGLVQERLKYFGELPELTEFFFAELPVDPDLIKNHKQLKKLSKNDLMQLLVKTKGKLDNAKFDTESLQRALNDLLNETNQKPSVLFSLIRIATTQSPASPGLAESLAVLGKDVAQKRIQKQIEAL